jgi:hypothetical protein
MNLSLHTLNSRSTARRSASCTMRLSAALWVAWKDTQISGRHASSLERYLQQQLLQQQQQQQQQQQRQTQGSGMGHHHCFLPVGAVAEARSFGTTEVLCPTCGCCSCDQVIEALAALHGMNQRSGPRLPPTMPCSATPPDELNGSSMYTVLLQLLQKPCRG